MKYSAPTYGKALAQALTASKGKNEAVIAKNFLALIRRNGDEARLGAILAQAELFLRRANGDRKIAVMSARPLAKPVATILKGLIKPHDTVEATVDPELVAGIKIVIDDELQFDGSLKGKLDTLFANVL